MEPADTGVLVVGGGDGAMDVDKAVSTVAAATAGTDWTKKNTAAPEAGHRNSRRWRRPIRGRRRRREAAARGIWTLPLPQPVFKIVMRTGTSAESTAAAAALVVGGRRRPRPLGELAGAQDRGAQR